MFHLLCDLTVTEFRPIKFVQPAAEPHLVKFSKDTTVLFLQGRYLIANVCWIHESNRSLPDRQAAGEAPCLCDLAPFDRSAVSATEQAVQHRSAARLGSELLLDHAIFQCKPLLQC